MKTIQFRIGDMIFEYDEDKNRINLEKHGISLKTAALVFFDYDRIEFFDETHSDLKATGFEKGLYYGKYN